MTARVLATMAQGVEYLLRVQDADGGWRDYDLPVGVSDHWVTAFTGLGAVSAAEALDSGPASRGAHQAAVFLEENQEYASGWGYNRKVGVDADSTAHVLWLQRKLGLEARPQDAACLLSHQQADGGFSTFVAASCWGQSHPDVTAAAGLSLAEPELQKIRQSVSEFVIRSRLPDGSWPSYWWRNSSYGICYMLWLLDRLGGSAVEWPQRLDMRVDSCFDLAWTLGCLAFLPCPETEVERLIELLCDAQEPSGCWPASFSLRVTDPECEQPWLRPEGLYYKDHKATITTASALRALGLIVERRRPR